MANRAKVECTDVHVVESSIGRKYSVTFEQKDLEEDEVTPGDINYAMVADLEVQTDTTCPFEPGVEYYIDITAVTPAV